MTKVPPELLQATANVIEAAARLRDANNRDMDALDWWRSIGTLCHSVDMFEEEQGRWLKKESEELSSQWSKPKESPQK